MIFDKAEEYLFDIFSTKDIEHEFQILCNSKSSNTLGGFLENGDAYLLNKGTNKIGLRINNGKYSFIQQRQKFINAPEFQDIIKNDKYFPEDDFIDTFKDVDFVQFFESDKENNSVQKLSYLVNKSTYLLINYFNQFSKTDNNSVSLSPCYMNAICFYKLELSNPANPNFDIKNLDNISLFIPNNHQNLYDIRLNNKNLKNENQRKQFINKIYSAILDADKNSYVLKDDFSYCIDTVSKSIEKQSGNENLDER